jgi:hypothetical protein
MDNHSVHNSPEVLSLYDQYEHVPIWLPPYSTYCLRPLDLQILSSFKSHHANLHTPLRKPQLEGKLFCILHAWHNASRGDVVYSDWRLGEIEGKRRGNPHHPGVVNLRTTRAMMRKACSDAQVWFAESDGQPINRGKA